MKPLVPVAVSAAIGVALGAALVFGSTAALAQNTRPSIDRTGNATSSLLNQVEYGTR